MTKEEAFENLDALAKSINGELVDYSDADHLIEAIYDDFENKVCENCKYFEDTTKCRHPYNKQYYYCDGESGMPMSVSKDFGCILFERRENEINRK